jgi:hypothetical protein
MEVVVLGPGRVEATSLVTPQPITPLLTKAASTAQMVVRTLFFINYHDYSQTKLGLASAMYN